MKFKFLFFFAFFLLGLSLIAQDNKQGLPPQQIGAPDDVQLLYRNELSGGIFAHAHGFGLNFRRAWHVTGFKKRTLELEWSNIKHSKEIKSTNPLFENAKSFYYGKLNAFSVLRAGYGFQKELYGKQDRRGVQIRLNYFVGPSLGIVKPVYLQVLKPTADPQEYVIATEKYDPDKHFIDNIYGRAPYFKGFADLTPVIGGYVKLGLMFEYADLDDHVKAIETGIALDIFPKVIPIMANARNDQVFPNLYIKIIWGRKWF